MSTFLFRVGDWGLLVKWTKDRLTGEAYTFN